MSEAEADAEQSEAELLATPRCLGASVAEGNSAKVFLDARLSFFETTGSHVSSPIAAGVAGAGAVDCVSRGVSSSSSLRMLCALASTRTSTASSALSGPIESCKATVTGGASAAAGGDGDLDLMPKVAWPKVSRALSTSSEARRPVSEPITGEPSIPDSPPGSVLAPLSFFLFCFLSDDFFLLTPRSSPTFASSNMSSIAISSALTRAALSCSSSFFLLLASPSLGNGVPGYLFCTGFPLFPVFPLPATKSHTQDDSATWFTSAWASACHVFLMIGGFYFVNPKNASSYNFNLSIQRMHPAITLTKGGGGGMQRASGGKGREVRGGRGNGQLKRFG